MVRIVLHRGRGPVPVRDSKGRTVAAVCMCGLSKKYPFCDGSHIKVRDEADDKIYIYSADSERLKELSIDEFEKLTGLRVDEIRQV